MVSLGTYTYIYMYICICIYVYIYVYITHMVFLLHIYVSSTFFFCMTSFCHVDSCLENHLVGGFKHVFYLPFHIWDVILPID